MNITNRYEKKFVVKKFRIDLIPSKNMFNSTREAREARRSKI